MKKYINNFLEYLEVEEGLSRKTTDNYKFYLNRFFKFAFEHGAAGPVKISKELVHKYISGLIVWAVIKIKI